MKAMKLVWVSGFAGVLALSTVGCSASSTASNTSEEKVKIGMVVKQVSNPYFAEMIQGAKAAAKKTGADLTIASASSVTDDSGQANALNSLVSAGKDCYIFNPISGTNLIQPLAKATKQGAALVNIDALLDTNAAKARGVKLTTYLGTDNKKAGEAAGKLMLTLVPAGSKVAILGGVQGDPGGLDRPNGFRAAVAGKLTVAAFQYTDTSRLQGQSMAAAIIRGNPNIKGIFTIGGDLAVGAQSAVDAAGMSDQIKVVGVDGIQDQLSKIKAGTMAGAIEQFPYEMGYQGVEACIAAKAGKKIPASVPTPVLAVTSANAAEALASFPAPPESFKIDDPFATK